MPPKSPVDPQIASRAARPAGRRRDPRRTLAVTADEPAGRPRRCPATGAAEERPGSTGQGGG